MVVDNMGWGTYELAMVVEAAEATKAAEAAISCSLQKNKAQTRDKGQDETRERPEKTSEEGRRFNLSFSLYSIRSSSNHRFAVFRSDQLRESTPRKDGWNWGAI